MRSSRRPSIRRRNSARANAGAALAAETKARQEAIVASQKNKNVLYLTSKGAVAGRGTLIDDVLTAAGFENFYDAQGWGTAPLERLAYEHPDVIAAGFFETSDLVTDRWTPTRHPVARRRLAETRVIKLPGAWTACGAWFNLDAAEALATAE